MSENTEERKTNNNVYLDQHHYDLFKKGIMPKVFNTFQDARFEYEVTLQYSESLYKRGCNELIEKNKKTSSDV